MNVGLAVLLFKSIFSATSLIEDYDPVVSIKMWLASVGINNLSDLTKPVYSSHSVYTFYAFQDFNPIEVFYQTHASQEDRALFRELCHLMERMYGAKSPGHRILIYESNEEIFFVFAGVGKTPQNTTRNVSQQSMKMRMLFYINASKLMLRFEERGWAIDSISGGSFMFNEGNPARPLYTRLTQLYKCRTGEANHAMLFLEAIKVIEGHAPADRNSQETCKNEEIKLSQLFFQKIKELERDERLMPRNLVELLSFFSSFIHEHGSFLEISSREIEAPYP